MVWVDVKGAVGMEVTSKVAFVGRFGVRILLKFSP